jgi:glycyl-tRNA synthetase
LIEKKWTDEDRTDFFAKMESDNEITLPIGDGIKITAEFIKLEKKEKTVIEEKYVPHVIEPSFGIGRIIYCVFEHCFKVRP